MMLHSQMYEVADKYDVPGLKELAKKKFSLACAVFWDSGEFAVAAEHAYTTTMEDDEVSCALDRRVSGANLCTGTEGYREEGYEDA
jgi:hypothetical protein